MQFSPLFRYFLFIGPLFIQYGKYSFFAPAYVTYSGSCFYFLVELIQELLKNKHIFIVFLDREAVKGSPGRSRLSLR